MIIDYNVSDTIIDFLFKQSFILFGEFCFHSTFWPNNCFDPRNIIGHSGIDSGRVLIATVFPERCYTDLRLHTRVIGVFYLQWTARIALR